MKSRHYLGQKTRLGYAVCTEFGPLDPRHDEFSLSKGYSWGDNSSGAKQLAYALCADAVGPRVALRVFERFAIYVISRLPGDAWELERSDVLDMIASVIETDSNQARIIH